MKLLVLVAFILALSVSSRCFAADGDSAGGKKKELLHVVAIKFKESATKDQIKQVEEAFAALKTKVPGVVSLKWGVNVSPEHHDKGFTHGFVLSFASEKDRNVYLEHPAHKEFGKLLGPIMADVFVIDFWANE